MSKACAMVDDSHCLLTFNFRKSEKSRNYNLYVTVHLFTLILFKTYKYILSLYNILFINYLFLYINYISHLLETCFSYFPSNETIFYLQLSNLHSLFYQSLLLWGKISNDVTNIIRDLHTLILFSKRLFSFSSTCAKFESSESMFADSTTDIKTVEIC